MISWWYSDDNAHVKVQLRQAVQWVNCPEGYTIVSAFILVHREFSTRSHFNSIIFLCLVNIGLEVVNIISTQLKKFEMGVFKWWRIETENFSFSVVWQFPLQNISEASAEET